MGDSKNLFRIVIVFAAAWGLRQLTPTWTAVDYGGIVFFSSILLILFTFVGLLLIDIIGLDNVARNWIGGRIGYRYEPNTYYGGTWVKIGEETK